ncbi:SET domain-containing protein [Cladophialophora immunda]|nr:SET domain-containing protein [Cladophialophora immunda]
METCDSLTKWAVSNGIKVNGVAAHKFPGKGLGIVAKRRLKAGEVILDIPMSVIRTGETVSATILNAVQGCSVNGYLATEMAMDTSDIYALWRTTLPSMEELHKSMPLFWPPELQDLLPPPALALLRKQQGKVSRDWNAVSAAFPQLSYDAYHYSWLLVSTRTFYYTPPDMEPEDTPEAEECLALVPFGDYFNHSDAGCKVAYSATGYEFKVDHTIEKGEELYISYGSHPNDFLLVEYGFILEENKWDEVSLDAVVLPLFSEKQKGMLEEAGYLGNYVLEAPSMQDDGVACYRTRVALRLLCMPLEKWNGCVTHGADDDDEYQSSVHELLRQPLKAYLEMVDSSLEQIARLKVGLPSQRDVLRRRWEQIGMYLTAAIDRIEQ